ncbi:spore germination protein [Clostridium aestuarii]|uniref:Spore germination protein n=1 Tax=Clostridium aestuarii TaxID=338193 RepID=A0ABT4CZ64_9CLOT|nr:spore germination protein [Clostridium aestuarii]MCY6484279.1 spore germination protein [Clostridium aestuarii]
MDKRYIDYIKEKLKDNFDIKYRIIECTEGKIYVIFISDLCDSKFISEYIISPLMQSNVVNNIENIKGQVLVANDIGDVNSEEDAVFHILSGDVVMICDFWQTAIYCEAKGFSKRSIDIPPTEAVIKGPREGFTEVSVDNVALIRRRIKNENLKFESLSLGQKSNTAVMICYIKETAPQTLVRYVKNIIENINTDFVLDINYIEEKLKYSNTVFDTIGYTEKPDIAASKLFEGKVIVIVDGSPQVVIAPYFFLEHLQAADDYYLTKHYVNISRLQRWIAFLAGLLLPGLYVALTTYHSSLIPTIFVFRLANARAGVPFPTIVEVLLMIIFFQLLREAGIRLPQPTGQAMSIVGALILGEAAIGAGLASQSTIVVVALSSIATFLIPTLYKAILTWEIIILMFSSLLGLPGFYMGFFILISHLAVLDSCGYPYLYPLGTLQTKKLKDVVVRGNLSEISKNIFDEDGK